MKWTDPHPPLRAWPGAALSVALAVVLSALPAAGENVATARPATGGSIESVGQLILQSSAAKQITTSGNEDALAKYSEAKDLYRKALEARDNGDAAEQRRLLDEASRTMFQAVRLAKPESVVGDKQRADFNKRLDSLNQLLQAHERVRKEKGSTAGKAEVNGPIKEKLDRARSLYDAGKLDEARAVLDEAYAEAKEAMGLLHGGDTVVRSLNFASKEEEYRYELDRNETHRVLLGRVLDDKGDRPELRTQAQPFVDRAAELRRQAESAAAAKNYDKAVQTLEQSTSELVRAIRAAGIFIPG